MGGIARENKMKALAIGGDEEHAHVFLSLPSTLSISKAIQLIKGGSSTWVSKTFDEFKDFQWQEGYGAFSVSISHIENTINYINNQKEHHKKQTFQEEYLMILKKHGVEYDEQYLWGWFSRPDGTLGLMILFPEMNFWPIFKCPYGANLPKDEGVSSKG